MNQPANLDALGQVLVRTAGCLFSAVLVIGLVIGFAAGWFAR